MEIRRAILASLSAPWPGAREPLSKEALHWAMGAAATCDSLQAFLQRCESDAALFRWPEMEAKLKNLPEVEQRLAEWESIGIGMLARFDAEYPSAWRVRLGDAAPPVAFVFGNGGLLGTHAIGIVGSREAASQALDFARELGERCAEMGMTVVSGGARGVDSSAVAGAWTAGGSAVAVLGDSLERVASAMSRNDLVAMERTAVVSPHLPSAPFNVGAAMGRNKLIYALSAATIVVCSAEGEGGTWAGAREALRKSYGRVLAWRASPSIPGNEALIAQGATPVATLEDFERELERPVFAAD